MKQKLVGLAATFEMDTAAIINARDDVSLSERPDIMSKAFDFCIPTREPGFPKHRVGSTRSKHDGYRLRLERSMAISVVLRGNLVSWPAALPLIVLHCLTDHKFSRL
jgi:hypothetical protein